MSSVARLAGVVAAVLVSVWTGPLALAATTGRLVVVVADESGSPIYGAVVRLSRPGTKVEVGAVSDETGAARFERLEPGSIALEIELDGVLRASAVADVELGRNSLMRVELPGPVTIAVPTVRVIERAPPVDLGSSTGLVLGGADYRSLPAARSAESIAALSPGASHDGLGLTLRGASSPENVWLVNGFDTTDVGMGLPTGSLPLELVEQLSVRTGGYGAEYGGAAGGVVDLVTRSGSDTFEGELFLHYSSGALMARGRAPRPRDSVLWARAVPDHQLDLGLAVGGPIIEDRAWFFVGLVPFYDSTRHTSDILLRGQGTDSGEDDDAVLIEDARRVFSSSSKSLTHMARFDVRPTESQRGSLTIFGNPTSQDGVIDPSLMGDEAAVTGLRRSGADNVVASWHAGLLGGRLLVDPWVGYQSRRQSLLPIEGDDVIGTLHSYPYLAEGLADLPECEPTDPSDPATSPCAMSQYSTGPFWLQEDSRLSRVSTGSTFTHLVELAGFHAFRWGGRVDADRFGYRRGAPGGFIQRDLGESSPARYQRIWLGDMDESGSFVADPFLETDARGTSAAAFIQDTWEPMFGLSIDAGLRLETQWLHHPEGGTAIFLRPEPSPRVGAAWDWTGEGRSRLHAHLGRYQQRIPLNVVARAFGGAVSAAQFLAEDGTNLTPTMVGEEYLLIGDQDPWVQPGLRAPYHDELQIGVEYAVTRRLALGLTLVHRQLGRIVEDVALDENARRFAIANPGDEAAMDAAEAGARARLAAATGEEARARAEDDLASIEALRLFPSPRRDYQAMELTLRTAPGGRWVLIGSAVLSRQRGNYSGFYNPENQQLDPNVTPQFDLPGLLVNRDGPLKQDRPLRLRMDAIHRFEFGLTAGLSYSYASGRPIDYLGSHWLYGRREVFILPRGSGGRTPALHGLDFALGYALPIGGGLKAHIDVAVFNLLDLQRPVQVDDAYTFDYVAPIEDRSIDELRSADGSLAFENTDGEPVTVNPGWGEPRGPHDLQPPRQLRIGLRVAF